MYRPHHSNAKSSFPLAPNNPQQSVPSAQPAKDQCQAWAAKTVAHLELANTIRSEGRPRRVVTGTAESSSCLRPHRSAKFADNILSDVALAVEKDLSITWYSIASENFASFHNHNGYAQINRQKTHSAIAERKDNRSPTLPGQRKPKRGGFGLRTTKYGGINFYNLTFRFIGLLWHPN